MKTDIKHASTKKIVSSGCAKQAPTAPLIEILRGLGPNKKLVQHGQNNLPKNNKNQQKSVQNRSLGPSWGVLGPTWRPSCPQELPRALRRRKKHFVGPPPGPPRWSYLGGFWDHVGAMLAGFGGRLVVRRPSYPA